MYPPSPLRALLEVPSEVLWARRSHAARASCSHSLKLGETPVTASGSSTFRPRPPDDPAARPGAPCAKLPLSCSKSHLSCLREEGPPCARVVLAFTLLLRSLLRFCNVPP